ncbi:Crp/Fnr family transcriptional regulator [Pedobacter nyackensis]|uniref:CRP/FNR family transcriptional regulator, anaerobic regulatory protein n=1 Tax=Pedobacter nyackensis TaxID=475255 RepID=A0A1W2E063_9SPHI|nr:Crp/Fnr family transcriptional regulator [Pedobacter nyackensis]SMD03181.1 CRP/FNR family transcriptional regulator, anaerobic regulatory protein [Pedobacter nyackensis]
MKNEVNISEYIQVLFPQFEPALKQILIENGVLKSFEAGEMLMQTGQNMRSTILIAEGLVKLYREGDEGNEFFMYYLHPGNACALSMICATKQETSQVMAKAVEPTKGLMIPISLMDTLMKEYKTWYYFVLETYRSRFEELLTVVDNIAFKSMDERLEFYLKKQHRDLKSRSLTITHGEIANDLNSSREVISRLLKKMEQRGEVILHRNYIEYLK